MKTSMFRRSCSGGTFWIPAKNWSYLFFSLPDVFLELVELVVLFDHVRGSTIRAS